MSNSGKYDSEEKLLYLADKNNSGLNVRVGESKHTDLSIGIHKLVKKGFLEFSKRDAVNRYYRITNPGKVRLLELQIAYRNKHNKPTDEHRKKLSKLTGEITV